LIAATVAVLLARGFAATADELACDALPGTADADYAHADLVEASRLLKLAFRADQCTRQAMTTACKAPIQSKDACSAARLRMSLTDIGNTLRLAILFERHEPKAILEHDPEAFRAAVFIMHRRPILSDFGADGTLYRDRRQELLPLIDQSEREGAIEKRLFDQFTARLREDQGNANR
jgi:hypothetical protein